MNETKRPANAAPPPAPVADDRETLLYRIIRHGRLRDALAFAAEA